MRQQSTIKVIGFDLDDTLWPIKQTINIANKETWKWLCDAYPPLAKHTSVAQLSPTLNTNQRAILEQYQHQISLARIHLMQFWLEEAGANPAQAKTIAEDAMHVFLDFRHQLAFYPGAIDCLYQLKNHFLLASISNGNANVNRIDAIKNIFDFSINAQDINSSKPEPDLFLKTLAHFNCQAHEMIYIGDDLEKDVEAAQACGIHAILLRHSSDNTPSIQHKHQVSSFTALLECIDIISTTK